MQRAQNTKGKILYTLATNSIAQRHYLTSISGNTQTLYAAIRELEKNNCIERVCKRIKNKGQTQRVTFFHITQSGLIYLKNYCAKFDNPDKTEWLKYITNVSSFDNRTFKGLSNQRLVRFLEIANASAFMCNTGYNSSDLFFESNEDTEAATIAESVDVEEEFNFIIKNIDDHVKAVQTPCTKNTLKTIVETARKQCTSNRIKKENKQSYNGNNDITVESNEYIQGIYLNTYELKKKLIQLGAEDVRCRYAGIVESPFKTVLVYTSRSATKGVPIGIKRGELMHYYTYISKLSTWQHTELENSDNAIVLVKNESEAKRVYENRKSYSMSDVVIIPVCLEGAEAIKQYMQIRVEDEIGAGCTKEQIADIVKQGSYKQIGWGAIKQFEIEGKDKEKITIVPYLNVNKLEFIEEQLESGNLFKIMAPQWMWKYIMRIIPEASEIMIPMRQ